MFLLDTVVLSELRKPARQRSRNLVRWIGGIPSQDLFVSVLTIGEIERAATITLAEGKPSPREMLQQALDNERRIIDGMRRGAKQSEECGDYGTNDLFSQHVQTHEKYAWFIEEFLKKNDGMGT